MISDLWHAADCLFYYFGLLVVFLFLFFIFAEFFQTSFFSVSFFFFIFFRYFLCFFLFVLWILFCFGEVVEKGSVRDIFHNPSHPYTQKLLQCDPAAIKQKTRDLPTILGSLPDLIEVPKGCIFAERCDSASANCHENKPKVSQLNDNHMASCHLLNEAGALYA